MAILVVGQSAEEGTEPQAAVAGHKGGDDDVGAQSALGLGEEAGLTGVKIIQFYAFVVGANPQPSVAVLAHRAHVAQRQEVHALLTAVAEGKSKSVGAHPDDVEVVVDMLQGIVGQRHQVVVNVEPLLSPVALVVGLHESFVVGGEEDVVRMVFGHATHHIVADALPGFAAIGAEGELCRRVHPEVVLRVDEYLKIIIRSVVELLHEVESAQQSAV